MRMSHQGRYATPLRYLRACVRARVRARVCVQVYVCMGVGRRERGVEPFRAQVLNNYAHIFDLLIRLRQAVNHPYLVQYSEKNYLAAQGAAATGHDASCGLCKEPCENAVATACRHHFCRACLEEYMDSAPADPVTCPRCDKPLSVDLDAPAQTAAVPAKIKTPPIVQRLESVETFRSSTKIEALLEELEVLCLETVYICLFCSGFPCF